jgi:hypothetical protein
MTTPILKQIAELPTLPQARLKALWREYFGTEPPAYRKGFLVRRLAHRIQELTYGGLSPAHQARLEALIADEEAPGNGRKQNTAPAKGERLLLGTRLVREWKGVAHEVTVIEGGFEYQGRRYRSLSAVARAITGTRWNGPLFFGLRSHRGERAVP